MLFKNLNLKPLRINLQALNILKMRNKFSQMCFDQFLQVHDSECMKTVKIVQQRPQRYTRYDKNRQRLKSTCNCTHEFHFPSEFSIISSHSRNSLKETFPNYTTSEPYSQHSKVNRYNCLLYLIFVCLQKAAHLVLRTAASWKQTDQDHMHRLTARIPGALESFMGVAGLFTLQQQGEGNYLSRTTSGLHQ